MEISPSDPTVETIVGKIRKGLWDLQPDFQRGEVWSLPKKQRLIDSILRGWHVPPVHTIEVRETNAIEVLDGQQRLTAIRDFYDNLFPIQGNQEPFDQKIQRLSGKTYAELTQDQKNRIDDFTIRVLTVKNYEPEEPGELFYRLNQPTNLTAAEQRNAFYGRARSQIKAISKTMQEVGLDKETIGFSNSRMAYDDVISRVATTLDKGTLNFKITANAVTEKFRSKEGFKESSVDKVNSAVKLLSFCLNPITNSAKLNKATLYSWLCVLVRYESLNLDTRVLPEVFKIFEMDKSGFRKSRRNDANRIDGRFPGSETLLDIYQDRSSSRVGDVSSVLLRDIITWIYISKLNPYLSSLELNFIYENSTSNSESESLEDSLYRLAIEKRWGSLQ